MSEGERAVIEIRAWVRERIHESPTFKLPEVAREAMAHFGGNAAFLKRLFAEQLYSTFYSIVRDVAARGRYLTFGRGGRVVHADPESIEVAFEENPSRSIFDDWTERVGDEHIHLKALTRTTLELAIGGRWKGIFDDTTRVRFLESLRDLLKGRKTLGESATDDALASRWAQVNRSDNEEAAD